MCKVLGDGPKAKEIGELWMEYEENSSLEAKVVKDFDKELHLIAVKRIIRYVNGTLGYGIWYPFDTNVTLAAYSDVDWARNVDDRNSTSGCCFYLRNTLVSWHSKTLFHSPPPRPSTLQRGVVLPNWCG
ncbi:hypothetical protein F0562_029711 [Nyssa sinensis]|uniref:HD domain-containing protein n=1 Tax=Nyssa sinensis TaxID=561372 RepID=A0A5J5B1U8_9ASTE|nr:hypothetical protein F0562_029711 [Nyssa sinensis]